MPWLRSSEAWPSVRPSNRSIKRAAKSVTRGESASWGRPRRSGRFSGRCCMAKRPARTSFAWRGWHAPRPLIVAPARDCRWRCTSGFSSRHRRRRDNPFAGLCGADTARSMWTAPASRCPTPRSYASTLVSPARGAPAAVSCDRRGAQATLLDWRAPKSCTSGYESTGWVKPLCRFLRFVVIESPPRPQGQRALIGSLSSLARYRLSCYNFF
jgi:hypothetical protein